MRRIKLAGRNIYEDKALFAALALTISFLAIGAAFGALVYTASSNAARVDDIERVVDDVQRSRFEATWRSCKSRSQDRRRIAGFVARIAPKLDAAAAAAFPPIAPNCRAYARRTVQVR